MFLEPGIIAWKGDCIIAATVLSLFMCACLLFSVLFFFFLLFENGDWVGLPWRNGLEFFFSSYPYCLRNEGRMGRTEAKDVDKNLKTVFVLVLVRTISTLVTKQRIY